MHLLIILANCVHQLNALNMEHSTLWGVCMQKV